MKYSAFGQILEDTNPDLYVVYGFAGGIYNPDAELIHFHFRDYDPFTGRWTARDPVLFSSSQDNLYMYVYNDPINLRDPLGLWCVGQYTLPIYIWSTGC